MLEVACWAHARRGIFEEHAKTKSAIAMAALDLISVLFAIEREINGQSADTRLAVRQERSVPLLAEIKTFLEANLKRVSRKGDLAKAFRHCLDRRAALSRFTLDGRL